MVIKEHQLPDDISADDYIAWYQSSTIIDGVRTGHYCQTSTCIISPDLSDTVVNLQTNLSNKFTHKEMLNAHTNFLINSCKQIISDSMSGDCEKLLSKLDSCGLPAIIYASSDIIALVRHIFSMYAMVVELPGNKLNTIILSWAS
jgi:hypothetical protein